MYEDDELIDKREVARRFGVSIKTIERYCRRAHNPMPFTKPYENGAVRFSWAAVDAWWQGVEPPAAAAAQPSGGEPCAAPADPAGRGCAAVAALRRLEEGFEAGARGAFSAGRRLWTWMSR